MQAGDVTYPILSPRRHRDRQRRYSNVIESAFSIVERVCRNMKRWHGGDQRERWVGSGLLVAEKQFRRITGYKQIPALIRELEALTPAKTAVVKRRRTTVMTQDAERRFSLLLPAARRPSFH